MHFTTRIGLSLNHISSRIIFKYNLALLREKTPFEYFLGKVTENILIPEYDALGSIFLLPTQTECYRAIGVFIWLVDVFA